MEMKTVTVTDPLYTGCTAFATQNFLDITYV